MIYNVRDFGARGDGVSLDHEAIQRTLDMCGRDGGGQVVVPRGTYLCGTIRLRSNVRLHLDMGAVILAAEDESHFPEICKTPFGNLPGQIQALLWADHVENLTICGDGIVDGGQNKPLRSNDAVGVKFRPALIFCRDCRNIKFIDVTMRYASFWTLHLLRCTDVAVRGVTILANQDRINTDGIDPDGCKDVRISDCDITTGDDCIVIKSTEGDLSENITVTNCVLKSKQAALKLGTEAIGDIRNVVFSNLVIRSNVGLALYMKDGSTYENIISSNIIMDVTNDFPLILDITPRYYREPRIGKIRNVTLSNIDLTGKGRFYIEGMPGSPVTNVSLRDIAWTITGPCRIESARKPIGARRVELDPNSPNHATQPYQLVIVNAQGVSVDGLRLYDRTGAELKKRGLLYISNSGNIDINNVQPAAGRVRHAVAVTDSTKVRLDGKELWV
jgi:hypothetical protein